MYQSRRVAAVVPVFDEAWSIDAVIGDPGFVDRIIVVDDRSDMTRLASGSLRRLDLDALHGRYFFENEMRVQLDPRNSRVVLDIQESRK